LRPSVLRPLFPWLLVGACSGTVGGIAPPDRDPSLLAPGTGNDNDGTAVGPGPGGGAASTPNTDPGRVTLHRLNRVEYNNTVRDLLGTTLRPADDFPADDRGYGFDNVADVLSLSPLHLDMYQRAAEQLVGDTLAGSQRKRVLGCDLESNGCVESSLRSFARRAWRRPPSDSEIAKLMTLVSLAKSNGDRTELGFGLALQAVLISPHFVFRVELDPTPSSTTPHALTSHELATRLSYFLWSTTPDDELSGLADNGKLTQPDVLVAQVARMLASDKAAALVQNFAGQWLYTRKIDEVQPDSAKFPNFDAALRTAMKRETELLFEQIAFHGLPANELLTANFTFLNDRLAKHYGLPAVGSAEPKRVQLSGDQRTGFLSHAGILTVTSHPTGTSPVLRGKWVLNELLCQAIPPPPPGVDTKVAMETMPTGSLRQRLEEHRSNPACASCHNLMDPIGFGLENYDPVGVYRTQDGAFPVDASGALPDGSKFSGARELAALVSEDERFPRCMTEKLYTYALGRAPDLRTSGHMDEDTLAALVEDLQQNDFDFAKLITGIVTSEPFLKRRGEASAGAMP
jgi:Protein of unknown function (DUF1592)/Protein of unknown function (DUF1588)/Protein of unknown function (DUF1587)/Protein of unknown function (DUF1595)/Protein of unknown function (DUF1585)